MAELNSLSGEEQALVWLRARKHGSEGVVSVFAVSLKVVVVQSTNPSAIA